MTLIQKRFLKGTQEFRLLEDDHIAVSFSGGGTERGFTFSLLEIDPRPERIKIRSYAYLIVSVPAGIFAALMFIVAFLHSTTSDQGALATSGAILSGISIMCFREHRRKATNIVAFYSRVNGHALLTFWYGKPTKAAFDSFVQELTNRIKAAITRAMESRPDETIAGEIRALKKLVEDDLLTATEFEQAKKKLLESPNERRTIGFRPEA